MEPREARRRAPRPWKPFDHPQLGKIEIGGWNRFHASRNPPPQFLERELARFPKWLLWQALTSPKLELVAADADALGADSFRVRLVVQNTGWLPSYVSKRALERKVVRGVVAEIALPSGAQLLHGKRREMLGQLEGKAYKHTGVSFWPDYNVTDDRLKIEWVVRAKRGERIDVLVRGTRRRASCARASPWTDGEGETGVGDEGAGPRIRSHRSRPPASRAASGCSGW